MRAYTRAAQSYGSVQLVTGVATADNVQLIQMLFDGLAESLATARGHIENDNIQEKSNALSRASRILVGLQGALDFERGGELGELALEIVAIPAFGEHHVADLDLEALEASLDVVTAGLGHRLGRFGRWLVCTL